MMRPLHGRKYIKIIIMMAADGIAVFLATIAALLLRFNLSFEQMDNWALENALDALKFSIPITVFVFILMKLYQSVWTYAGLREVESIVAACIIATCVQATLLFLLRVNMPRSFFPLYGMVLVFLTGGNRLIAQFVSRGKNVFRSQKGKTNVMIIGAGSAGNILIREMMTSTHLNQVVRCIIDDDPEKIGRYIRGIRVVGNRSVISEYVKKCKIDFIVIAMPSVSRRVIRDILFDCQKTGCEIRVLPGIYQLVNGEVSISSLRKVQIEDLLGRDPVQIDVDSIMEYVNNKVVMVTGGGGSIGSELCRQLAEHQPKQLIVLDVYENGAYEIQQELRAKYPELEMEVVIASVCNEDRINAVLERFHPHIIYHAAAHKHVPLMESSPNEAVENNVFGTLTMVKAADRYGVQRFVMISTDKAVNPTNIMGATKRICEMIIQTWEKRSKTEFVAVRFGNVLGSNGSVIPLFKQQLMSGGPITVTHPDIIRYFMTIPEAVSLVLQAGALASGGEIFILDMGEPVKILDLAENLIRQSGLEPYKDIEIKFTGLRPGEKLYEELLMSEEGMQDTENQQIHIGHPIDMDEGKFIRDLEELKKAAREESSQIRSIVAKIVSTYHYEK